MTFTATRFVKGLAASALLLSAAATPFAANAERLLTENFEYNLGDLYPQGSWQRANTNGNPIQVVANQLTYEGYQATPKGYSVRLNPVDNLDQDVKKAAVDPDQPITSGVVYLSALVSVQAVEAQTYVLTFASKTASGFLDEKATSEIGRLFISPDADGFKFGMSKNAAAPVAESECFPLNSTHLVVMKYEFVEGVTNDVFTMWIDPSDFTTEPEGQMVTTANSDVSAKNGIVGLGIRQGTTAAKKCPEMLIGAVRMANTWADLFDAGQGEVEQKASITASQLDIPEFSFQYQKQEAVITVKAKEITEDITVGGLTSGEVSVSASTIPAAEACSEEGYKLTVTVNPTSGNSVNDAIVLTSGETTLTIPVSMAVQAVRDEARLAALNLIGEDYETAFRYTGSMARVTYVDKANKIFYLQDMTGAVKFNYSYFGYEECPYKEGDKVKNIYCALAEKAQNINTFMYMYGERTAEGSFQTPVEATLGEIKASPEDYINKLVKIEDVTFEGVAEGATFTTASVKISSPYMSGTAEGNLRPFSGTDVIGTPVPAHANSVVGISTSLGAAVITVRSLADIEAEVEEPALEVSKELLVDASEYYPINVATPVARFTVKATALPSPAMIWLGGTGRTQFSVDVEEIPAGTSETVVTVTFNPTKKGASSCNINFDATPVELSSSVAMTFKAYDPDNLPVLTVDQSTLVPFEANVGETMEQTINYTATGLLDYGKVRVLGQGNGAFQINSVTLMKDGTYGVKVTFAPKAEGTFTEQIEFSADKAETTVVTVTGSTTGGVKPEEKQGDELAYDMSSPLALYTTGFDTEIANNKPLALEGWKNVAVEGTRAWWSNTVDGDKTAKVTAYDSKAETDTPCEMLLLSPALDFKNCTSRLLSFRIMGQYMADNSPETLEVLYIDATEADNIYKQNILTFPASPDLNGDWQDYVIDLEGLDLADVFFVGFRFQGERGRNSSVVFNVDDFSWGRSDLAFIRVDTPRLALEAAQNETAQHEITVTGLNLTESIALSLEGTNPSKFSLSHETLPAEGGKFTLSFASEEIGVHQAYVRMQSAGAPDTYIEVLANNKENTGVVLPGVESAVRIAVYDLSGNLVVEETEAAEALSQLRSREKGVYILRTIASDGSVKAVKYLRP